MAGQWIDLTAYEMRLMIVDIPQNGTAPKRVMLAANGDAQPDALTGLGFRPLEDGAWAFDGAVLPTLPRLAAAFPQAVPVEYDRALHYRNLVRPAPQATVAPVPVTVKPAVPQDVEASVPPAPVPDREPGSATPVAELPATAPVLPASELVVRTLPPLDPYAHARLLGVNRLGQSVRENEEGRFVRDARGRVVTEAKMAGQPGLFLRAVDDQSMAFCADGFIYGLAQNARTSRFDNFLAFASAAYGEAILSGDVRLSAMQSAVEGALARRVLRTPGSSKDRFDVAEQLHHMMPYVAKLVRDGGARTSVPMPVAVAVRHLMGSEESLKGNPYTVVGAGTGSLFALVPKDVAVTIYEPDAILAKMARPTLAAAARLPSSLVSGEPVWEGTHNVVASFSPGYLDAPRDFDGLTVTRSDYAAMLDSLAGRAPKGRSAFVTRPGEDDADKEEGEAVREWIGRRYGVEGTIDIGGDLHSFMPEAEPLRLMIVGRARNAILEEAPKAAMRRTDTSAVAASEGDTPFKPLWRWTMETGSSRAKIDDAWKKEDAEDAVLPGGGADPTLSVNPYQAPYAALSKIGQASKMVPRNLDGATRRALHKLAVRHPDFDQWVCNEIGLGSDEIEAVLKPEQIDAIGMLMDAHDRGRAGMLADQTGIGKGRTLMALARRSVLQGKRVLIVSESDANLTDLMRDARHLKTEDLLSPFIVNADVRIVNEDDNQVTMTSLPKAQIDKVIQSKEWPAGKNVVLATYSQFGKAGGGPKAAAVIRAPGESDEALSGRRAHAEAVAAGTRADIEANGPKSAWLRAAVGDDVVILLDECHNVASGESNVSANMEAVLERAHSVVFSSSTFTKEMTRMRAYKRMFPKDFDVDEMPLIIRKGGQSMQETLSAALAEDGVLIRREHDLSGRSIVTVVDPCEERNIATMDALSRILREMCYLTSKISTRVEAANEERDERIGEAERADRAAMRRRMPAMAVSKTGFGSPLYLTTRLFMTSLKVDHTVETCLKILREGKKPVVLVENTVQSVLDEAMADFGGEGAPQPGFKDIMRRLLRQMTTGTVKRNGREVAVDLAVGDPKIRLAEGIVPALLATLPLEILHADAKNERGERRGGLANYRELALEGLHAAVATVKAANPDDADDDFEDAADLVRKLVEDLPVSPTWGARGLRNLALSLPLDFGASMRRVDALIEAMPEMPASAIDAVKNRIEAEGFSMGEITGRTAEVRADGLVHRRKKSDKTQQKNAFNAGEYDGMIMNAGGATGIDLHSGRRFKDRSQRVMVVMQELQDVAKLLQAMGRVDRTDQEIPPEILILLAGLPAEVRSAAMTNSKLRQLNASVTSNRDSTMITRDIPDMFNAVGDYVATEFGHERPDLMRRLGLESLLDDQDPGAVALHPAAVAALRDQARIPGEAVALAIWGPDGAVAADDEAGDGKVKMISRTASGMFARFAMLECAQARECIEILNASMGVRIEELNATGDNPFESRFVDGIVLPRERAVFEGAKTENPESVFDHPLERMEAIIEYKLPPMRGAAVEGAYQDGLMRMGDENLDTLADRLMRRKESHLKEFLPFGAVSVEDAIARGDATVIARGAALDHLASTLRELRPGSGISFNYDGERKGVVLAVHLPLRNHEHFASHYMVSYAAPGDYEARRSTLASLLNDPTFALDDGMHGEDQESVLRPFDEAAVGAGTKRRSFLVGNKFAAMSLAIEYKLGNQTAWQGRDGVRHRDVLVHERHVNLDFLPFTMKNAQMAAFVSGIMEQRLYCAADMKNVGGVHVQHLNGRFQITLPFVESRKWGGIYAHPPVAELLDRLATGTAVQGEGGPARNGKPKHREKLTVLVDAQELETVLGDLMDAGVRLYAGAAARPRVNAWLDARGGGAAPAPALETDEIEEPEARMGFAA